VLAAMGIPRSVAQGSLRLSLGPSTTGRGSLARLPASTVAVCAALEPVYGIALAFWLLHEVPGLRTIAGAALLVVAAIVASHRVRAAPPA